MQGWRSAQGGESTNGGPKGPRVPSGCLTALYPELAGVKKERKVPSPSLEHPSTTPNLKATLDPRET